MTAAPEPLWADGWDLEPCGDADADERAFLDLHGPQATIHGGWLPRACRDTETVHVIGEVL